MKTQWIDWKGNRKRNAAKTSRGQRRANKTYKEKLIDRATGTKVAIASENKKR